MGLFLVQKKAISCVGHQKERVCHSFFFLFERIKSFALEKEHRFLLFPSQKRAIVVWRKSVNSDTVEIRQNIGKILVE